MSALLRRNQEARVKEIARELLLLLPGTERALHLNEMASLIYALCDGTRTENDIQAEIVLEQAGIRGKEALSEAVSECIAVLVEQQALTVDEAQPAR